MEQEQQNRRDPAARSSRQRQQTSQRAPERRRQPDRDGRSRSGTPQARRRSADPEVTRGSAARGAAAPEQTDRTPEDAERRRTAARERRSREEDRERRKAPKAKKKRKPRRLRNTNFGIKFVTMLAVVAAVVLGLVIFFRIQHVEVVGNEYYTAEEVIDASGIAVDDNLLTLSKASIAANIRAKLPYVSQVQIKRSLPNRVVITVSEFEVAYAIQDEKGDWWLMNREGRILDPADAQTIKEHTIVEGMAIQPPEVGDEIRPATTEGADVAEIASKRDAILTLLELVESSVFAKQITSIDVSTSYDITMWYGTQYQIKLGNTEQIEYKMQYLRGVLDQLEDFQSGVIDLTFTEDKRAHFQPFS